MSNDGYVIEYLAELARQADAESVATYDGVVKDLAELKVPTLPDYWREGRMIDPDDWTPVMRAACKKYKVRQLYRCPTG